MKYFIPFGPDFITANAFLRQMFFSVSINFPRLDVSTLGRFDLLPYFLFLLLDLEDG